MYCMNRQAPSGFFAPCGMTIDQPPAQVADSSPSAGTGMTVSPNSMSGAYSGKMFQVPVAGDRERDALGEKVAAPRDGWTVAAYGSGEGVDLLRVERRDVVVEPLVTGDDAFVIGRHLARGLVEEGAAEGEPIGVVPSPDAV